MNKKSTTTSRTTSHKQAPMKAVAIKKKEEHSSSDLRDIARNIDIYNQGELRRSVEAMAGTKEDAPLSFTSLGSLDSTMRDEAVRHGLPVFLLDEAADALGLSKAKFLSALAISSTTASRREASGTLNLEESDRLSRLARLWHDAEEVFQDDSAVREWLTSQVPSLQHNRPLDLFVTHEGFERARKAILKLAYGVPG